MPTELEQDSNMELHELKSKGNLRLNILAKLPNDKIKKRCDAFAHELEQASSSAEKHATLAIQYKQWIQEAEEWFNEVEAEYPHQPILKAQIKSLRDGIKANITVDETYNLYNTLIKLVEIVKWGHQLDLQQSRFICTKCKTPFINILKIDSKQIPKCEVAHG